MDDVSNRREHLKTIEVAELVQHEWDDIFVAIAVVVETVAVDDEWTFDSFDDRYYDDVDLE